MTTSVVGGIHNIKGSRSSRILLASERPGTLHTCNGSRTVRQRFGTCSQRSVLQSRPSFPRQTQQQQLLPHDRKRAVRPAAISADAGIPVVAAEAKPVQSRGLGSLTSRIVSGSILGLGGGLIILAGGWIFTVATCLVAYQATQEFYGFITSKASTVQTSDIPEIFGSNRLNSRVTNVPVMIVFP